MVPAPMRFGNLSLLFLFLDSFNAKGPLLFHHVPQCSKSCGSGRQRRGLQCVDQNQQEVHEMYCVNLIRPPDLESCNTQDCELIWITGEWTEVRAQTACVVFECCVCHAKLFSRSHMRQNSPEKYFLMNEFVGGCKHRAKYSA